jgi:predicted AAA+ superfamily ATPase
MKYLKRQLDLIALLQKKSFFLLGPRSTGKTSLIKKTIPTEVPYLSLNNMSLYNRLVVDPSQLTDILMPHKKVGMAVIDEIQKMPELLNELQELIENEGFKFLLTGSSARKLKRTHANMLGGRARSIGFYPLSFSEIPSFDLNRYLRWGGLPRTYLAEDPQTELDSYIKTYLEEEVRLEANIRNLAPFHRFLKIAALSNGQLINYASISSDAAVPASTVKQYFEILTDSLIASTLEPWLESKKRKAIQTAKFYFFDPGVTHFFAGTEQLDRNSNLWGQSFEQFIFMELKCYASYRSKKFELNFWRSTDKHEVDFVINGKTGLEVKSTKRINASHLKGIKAIQEEKAIKYFYVVSEDPIERTTNGVRMMPWRTFLKNLWADQLDGF